MTPVSRAVSLGRTISAHLGLRGFLSHSVSTAYGTLGLIPSF